MDIIKTKSYDIHIEHGVFKRLFDVLHVDKNQRVFVVVDETVYDLYKQDIVSVFKQDTPFVVVEKGETSKSVSTYQRVLSTLVKKNIVKTDIIIGLGGGVIGDLTGFIAASLFRGMSYVHIPTTLLSMVDSSIGGKTALNLPEGKNLIGAFHEPKHVMIDPMFLKTLPAREIKSGTVEIIKAALIKDALFYQQLKKTDAITADTIKTAILIKKAVVEQDFFDTHTRHLLNFGHTFGHAIEQYFNYSITHGEAVAMGMIVALKLGVKCNEHGIDLLKDVEGCFQTKALISQKIPPLNEVMPYLQHDKKIKGTTIKFVFLRSLGEATIKSLDLAVVMHAFD